MSVPGTFKPFWSDYSFVYNQLKMDFKIGGSDQMGNIVSGHELISRMGLDEVYGW